MGAPTVYYSDDPGAPVVSNGQDAFYQILRACLVDGYGDKSAAGWAVVYDDWSASGNASFTNAGSSGVVGLKRTGVSNLSPFVYVAEAMASADQPINARCGYKKINSLDDLSDAYSSSVLWNHAVSKMTYYHDWCVIANENWAWFFVGSSGVFSVRSSRANYSAIGFGAINSVRNLGSLSTPESGNFIVFGGGATYSIRRDWDPSLANNSIRSNHSTAFYSADNVYSDVDSNLVYWPFIQGFQPAIANGIGETAGSVLDIDLNRVFAIYSEQQNSSGRYGSQIGFVPGLYSNSAMAFVNCAIDKAFAVRDLKDQVVMGGRRFLKARLWNQFAMLSVSESDWL